MKSSCPDDHTSNPNNQDTVEFESEDELVNRQAQPAPEQAEQPRSNDPLTFYNHLYLTFDPTFVTLLGT